MHAGAVFEPHNGTRRAAFDGQPGGQLVLAVVDYCQIVLDGNKAFRGIGGTAATARAQYRAIGLGGVTFFRVIAGHPQAVTDGMQGEQVTRADIHAVAAGRAVAGVDYWQPVPVHVDGVEVAHRCTITKPEAAPGAAFATARNQCCRATGIEAAVAGMHVGDVVAAGTGQPGDTFFMLAEFDAEEAGNDLVHFL